MQILRLNTLSFVDWEGFFRFCLPLPLGDTNKAAYCENEEEKENI